MILIMKEDNSIFKEKNLDILLDIAKDEYDVFFKRCQALDAKVGILITIIGSICAFSIKTDYLNTLVHNLTVYNYLEFLLYIGLLGLFIAILVLTANIIIAKNTSFMPLNIFDDEAIDEDTIELKRILLLNSYKQVLQNNDLVLRKKNKCFNAICILSIIEIGIVIGLQLFKIML